MNGKCRLIKSTELLRRYWNTDLPDRLRSIYAKEREHRSPDFFVGELSNAWVLGNEGLVMGSTGAILRQLEIENPDFDSIKIYKSIKKHGRTIRFGGRLALVSTHNCSNNYFHWMFDTVPRLESLIKMSPDAFWVPLEKPYHLEVLLKAGLPTNKLKKSDRETACLAQMLLFTSHPCHTGNPTSQSLLYIRKLFTSEIMSQQRKRRIFISRRDAAVRQIENEAEIVDFLENLGYETITLSKKTVSEQAVLFSSAKIIIAAHGAGLTNLAFCSPGTKLLELMPENWINACYGSLANLVGVEYHAAIIHSKSHNNVTPLRMDLKILKNSVQNLE